MAFASAFKLSICVLLFSITLAAGALDDLLQQFNESLRNPIEGLERIRQELENIPNAWPQDNSTLPVLPTGVEGLGMNMQHQMAALNNFMQQLTDMQRKFQGLNPQQEKKCPDSFKKFNNSCYFFGSLSVTRTKAKRSCEQMSSYLVEVESYAEDHFLVLELSALRRKSPIRPAGYLTGGTDRQHEGNWVWETSGRPIDYTNWAEGEGEAKRGRNYIAYSSRSWPHWVDVSDNEIYGFICEYDL